jgi:hypothetical protein
VIGYGRRLPSAVGLVALVHAIGLTLHAFLVGSYVLGGFTLVASAACLGVLVRRAAGEPRTLSLRAALAIACVVASGLLLALWAGSAACVGHLGLGRELGWSSRSVDQAYVALAGVSILLSLLMLKVAPTASVGPRLIQSFAGLPLALIAGAGHGLFVSYFFASDGENFVLCASTAFVSVGTIGAVFSSGRREAWTANALASLGSAAGFLLGVAIGVFLGGGELVSALVGSAVAGHVAVALVATVGRFRTSRREAIFCLLAISAGSLWWGHGIADLQRGRAEANALALQRSLVPIARALVGAGSECALPGARSGATLHVTPGSGRYVMELESPSDFDYPCDRHRKLERSVCWPAPNTTFFASLRVPAPGVLQIYAAVKPACRMELLLGEALLERPDGTTEWVGFDSFCFYVDVGVDPSYVHRRVLTPAVGTRN